MNTLNTTPRRSSSAQRKRKKHEIEVGQQNSLHTNHHNNNSELKQNGNRISSVENRRQLIKFNSSSDSSDSFQNNTLKLRNNQSFNNKSRIEIVKKSSARRQASVNSHKNVQRSTNHYNNENHLKNNDYDQKEDERSVIISERRKVKRKVPVQRDSLSIIHQPKRVRGVSVSRNLKSSMQEEDQELELESKSILKSNKKKCQLQFSLPFTFDHFYIQSNPQPLDGILVSKLNGVQNKSNVVQDDVLQYVQPIDQFIPGPTAPFQDRHQNKSQKVPISKVNNFLSSLFLENDDTSLQFFTLDFGTSYVSSIEDEDELEIKNSAKYYPNFYIFDTVSEQLVENLKQPNVIAQVLRIIFDNRSPLHDKNGFNLTTIMNPDESEVKYVTLNDITYIDCISPSAFFDFQFGEKVTEILPDKFHLFVWHNLGIPSLPIARNIEKVLKLLDPERMSNVAQYIFLWLYYYPEDFYDDVNCSDLILKMTKKLVNKNTDLVLCQAAIIRALVQALKTKTRTPDEFCLKLPSPNMRSVLKNTDLMDLDIDFEVLVNHFTYIDIEMMHQLKQKDFVHDNWKQRPDLSPNINKLIDRFNEVSSFIAASILIDNDQQRANAISFWINVMDTSRKMKNYHLVSEIDAALSCLPIKRLKNTWKLIDIQILDKYQNLRNFFDKKENKIEMMESPEITMPFIGLFLAELSQSFDDEPTKKPLPSGGDGYNLSLHRKYFNIIEKIFLDWGMNLRFDLDTKLLEECRVLSGRARKPADLILPSVNFEPPRPNEKRFLEDYLKKY